MWNWLVTNGLYHAVVDTLVGLPTAALLAWKPWQRHRASQRRIADLLDTTTPGGLTDVINAIQAEEKP